MSAEEPTASLADSLMAKHGIAESEPTVVAAPSSSADSAPETATSVDENITADSSSSSTPAPLTNGKSKKAIDIASYDAFPTLGSGKPAASSAVGSWGPGAVPAVKPATTPLAVRPTNKASSKSIKSDSFTLKLDQRNARSKVIPTDVLNRAQTNHSVIINCSTSMSDKSSHIIIKGKPENVRKARRELLRDLSIRISQTIKVPASARTNIIGPKGSNLKPIIENSGAQIQITKREDTPTQSVNDDEELLVDVKIEGDPEGVEIAKREIMAIVNSIVRTATQKIQGLPSKVYPALAGPNNSFVNKLESERKIKITIPDYFYLSSNNLESPIVISGERSAVIETKAELERLAQNILSSYTSVKKNLNLSAQRFLDPTEIFNNTGFVVSPIGKNEVELFGPSNNLKNAMAYTGEIVKKILSGSIDISKAHGNNISHNKILAEYFRRSGKFEGIANAHSVMITPPSAKDLADPSVTEVVIDLAGENKDELAAARKEIISLVNSFPSSNVLVVSDIEPFFLKNLTPKSSLITSIKKDKSIDVLVPEDDSLSTDIVFVYAGSGDEDFGPTPEEITNKLSAANGLLDDIRSKQKDITSNILDVPVENHKFILGPNGTTLNAILKGGEGDSFVNVKFGKDVAGESEAELTPSSVFIRGLSSEVKRVSDEIKNVIEEAKNYEVLSKYTTEFQFPSEHVNKLIGKGGANLTKIREEFGVNIDVDENGNGVVKGIKKNADEAKIRILNLGRRLADEVNLRLKVPNEYHATLIGTGGKFVKRLEDKYDVHIRFPKSNDTEDNSRDKPGKNEVLVRGPSRGAAKAQEEIIELLQYEIDNGHTQTITVPAKTLPRVIGRGGDLINDIKDTTNTRIDVGNAKEGAEEVPITVTGTKTGIKNAIERIKEVVKDIEDTVTEEIDVNPKYHRILIGSNGSAMREIVAKAGEEFNSRIIQIPSAGSNDSKIKINGKKNVVAKIVKIIQDIVDERESRVEIKVPVNPQRHGALIGPGGATKKEIESEFNVSVFVPKQGSKDSNGEVDKNIRVSGKPEDVEKAKAKIEELTAEVYKATVDVPKKFHSLLSENGMFIRKLRNDFNVRVDHGGVSYPKDTSIPIPPEALGDDSVEDKSLFKWTIAKDTSITEAGNDTIPWKLRGSDEDAAKAKEAIEKNLKNVEQWTSIGYLWLADPSRYRLVVGPKGKTINSVRNKSHCAIYVPKSDASASENLITLRGSDEQLTKAKDLILEAIARK